MSTSDGAVAGLFICYSLDFAVAEFVRIQKSAETYRTALPESVGVPQDRLDDNRLYLALDKLLPHKEALEVHLKNRDGELFDIEHDLLPHDVTSIFFVKVKTAVVSCLR